MPASGHQDHTPSPSARVMLVCRDRRVHRIPPRGRDDRVSPLFRDGTAANMDLIWGSEKQKYFCKQGWTGGAKIAEVICPSGRIVTVIASASEAVQRDLVPLDAGTINILPPSIRAALQATPESWTSGNPNWFRNCQPAGHSR